MKPNIIIFNPDQMRADALAHLGNPAALTPFLDQWAREEAVSFRRAFCQNPVCVPSRCSFATGVYPHTHGHRTMRYMLHPGEPTLFQELKEAGYHVWVNARNDLIAGQIPGLMEAHVSEIYCGGDHDPAPGPEENLRGEPGSKHFYSFYSGRLALDAHGRSYGSDDEDLDAAIDRIRHPVDGKPLCLFLGLTNPHPPYQVEEPYFSAVDRAKLPPRIDPALDRGKPAMEARIRANQQLDQLTEADWDELRACYLGMCMKVDAMFAKLCGALKEAGIYDNTAIFFFSDHGDYTGDHGISEKSQNTFEDCLTNVPLLIKPPKGTAVDPGITDSLAELVDFYATAMDYAGVAPNHTHFGRSLRPVVADRTQTVRDFVCCEGGRLPEELHCDEYHSVGDQVPKLHPYWPRMEAQTDPVAHGKATMLRTQQYKYISRLEEPDEFYDLEADPLEQVNAIDDPAYAPAVIAMQRAMLRWYQATADTVPFAYDMRATPEMTWAKLKRQIPPAYEAEFREKIARGANPFLLRNEVHRRFGSQKKQED